MPLSVLVEAVVELVALLLGEAAVDAGGAVVESHRERRQRRAHAIARVLVLAAWHDRMLTASERAQLEERLPPLLAKAGHTAEGELDLWLTAAEEPQPDDVLRAEVASLVEPLSPRERRRLFDAVVQVVGADTATTTPTPDAPYREASVPPSAATVRLFGEALDVDAARQEPRFDR